MLSPRLPLFVFGTLRRGQSNHHFLAGKYDRLLPAELAGYRRSVAAHGFPTILPDSNSRVDGELYFLTEKIYDTTLRNCDTLEGIAPGEMAGPHYRRLAVSVTTAEGEHSAWAYVDASAA